MRLEAPAEADAFIRRRGAGGSDRTLRIKCPHCGWVQWDVKAWSRKGSAEELTCAACQYTGPVLDR